MKRSFDKPVIAVVVPCFNEEEVLPETVKRLFNKIQALILSNKISGSSKILFVDDGSTDNTWSIIEKYYLENPGSYAGIKLTKNSGHQNALLCGLPSVKDMFDAAISIDADLQDDINAIDEMIAKFLDGCEIVYEVRSKRLKDTFLKELPRRVFIVLCVFWA
jgi:glycosyltransferase involved in cell wall biosynthesis